MIFFRKSSNNHQLYFFIFLGEIMLEFETIARNKYAWDEKTSLFIPFPETLKSVNEIYIKDKLISEETVLNKLNSNFKKEEIIFCFKWIKKWEKLKLMKSNHSSYSEDNIKKHILRNGLRNLLLNVTEDCNFRCHYCAFSGSYEDRRSHSTKYMKFKTAKKAIDYYLSLIIDGMKYNPLRKPTIGFYGGEPLLNFKLIKKCVNYIEQKYDLNEINYTISTNGSLLTESTARWLMEHQFSIYISLDGPEKEHDRSRVYKQGNGTFKDIMRNISVIMDSNYENIFIMSVYDVKSDLFEIEKFFNKIQIPISIIGEVDNSVKNLYYDQFTEKDYVKFNDQLERAESYYLENMEHCNKQNSPFAHLFGGIIRSDLCDANALGLSDPFITHTATCFPGYKIFVDTDGVFYICERVASFFPVGNVEEGLNYQRIVEIMQEYLKHMDKCIDCEIKTRCKRCFRDFETDNGFKCSSKVCEGIESKEIEFVTKSLDAVEQNSMILDYYCKYENIKKYCGD